MKKLSFLLPACLLFFVLGSASSAHAAGLIRSSRNELYWQSQDNKRYAFPDDGTFASWYPDAKRVTSTLVTDVALNKLPYAGNLLMKPGSYARIDTRPETYFVDRFGVLRFVRDLPPNVKTLRINDAQAINYIPGPVVYGKELASGELVNQMRSVEENLRTFSLIEDKTMRGSADVVAATLKSAGSELVFVSAHVVSVNSPASTISIDLIQGEGVVLNHCTGTTICTVAIPATTEARTKTYRARATNELGQYILTKAQTMR